MMMTMATSSAGAPRGGTQNSWNSAVLSHSNELAGKRDIPVWNAQCGGHLLVLERKPRGNVTPGGGGKNRRSRGLSCTQQRRRPAEVTTFRTNRPVLAFHKCCTLWEAPGHPSSINKQGNLEKVAHTHNSNSIVLTPGSRVQSECHLQPPKSCCN